MTKSFEARGSSSISSASWNRARRSLLALTAGLLFACESAALPLASFSGKTNVEVSTGARLAELRSDLRLLGLDQRGHGDASMPSAETCRAEPESCFRPEDLAADDMRSRARLST